MTIFWNPRSIGWRLTLGFACLIGLMMLALVKANLQISHMTNVTQRIATEDLQRLLRVQSLSLQTEGVGSALVRLMNAPRENRVAEYTDVDERNRRIDGIIEVLGKDMLDPVQQETLKRLELCRSNYAEAFIATVDQIEADDLPAAARALNDQVNPALKAMLLESNALLQRERESIEERLAREQASFERLANLLIALSALAVVLAVWLGVQTTRSVVNPLALLASAAQRIAQGDYSRRVTETSAREVDQVGQALNTMTDAVAQREQQIVQLAYHDPLTGLPNRTALLTPAENSKTPHSCLILMDLARLKGINETLGYSVGDTLIKDMGLRTHAVFQAAEASGLVGPGALVARLSGGTFAASFDAPDRAAVLELHGRLQAAMNNPVVCSGHSVDLSVAYGMADTGNAPVALSTNTLLRNAEVALHTAKKGALGFAWYSEAQEAARLSHLSLLSDLRVAVATSQLQMWLQPKFSLSTGLAVGAEALVRWQHPSRGFVSPAEFVPFAEQTGYIGMVTTWMLEQALLTLARWAPTHPELTIAVNMSTRDLLDPTFCQRVHTLLGQHNVPGQRLRLEIVESGLMDDPQTSVAVLHTLRDMGIKLSIDDFGTGYSSLAYLQKLPVSELKIDRSFVDGVDGLPGTQRLVKTMIEMGHGMGLMVTAEGVETVAERDTITRLGCDVMQGYLGSRPLHGAALQAWFDALAPVDTAQAATK